MLNIVYGVIDRRPLRRKFMKNTSALMHGIQNTKVTSTPVPMHTTSKELCAWVVRPSGKTSRITVKYAVAASGTPTIRAVAIVMAPSRLQAP